MDNDIITQNELEIAEAYEEAEEAKYYRRLGLREATEYAYINWAANTPE